MKIASSRERWLLILLPAGLVVAGYAWGFMADLQDSVNATEKELSAAIENAVPLSEVAAEQIRLNELVEEERELAEEKRELEVELSRLAGGFGAAAGSGRTQAMQDLSRLFELHGMTIVNETPSVGRDQMPKSLANAISRLEAFDTDADSKATVRMWRIQMVGRYTDLQRALTSMAQGGATAIPVSLSMAESQNRSSLRTWTLVVWL